MIPSANAVHESGHAVMAVLTGLPVEFVAIGRFAKPYEGLLVAATGREIRRLPDGLEKLARTLAGGDIAEQIFAGGDGERKGARADHDHILALAREQGLQPAGARDDYLTAACQRALDDLTNPANWHAVEQLALSLDRKERLEAAQILSVVRTACETDPVPLAAAKLDALSEARTQLSQAGGRWTGLIARAH